MGINGEVIMWKGKFAATARAILRLTFATTVSFAALVLIASFAAGCQPVERQAYQAVVAANAFLKSMRTQHPECTSSVAAATQMCTYLSQATASKDLLIDAVEVYCMGPDFAGGGKCNPLAKGTPAATQATAKLQAAIQNYERIESELKLAVKGNK